MNDVAPQWTIPFIEPKGSATVPLPLVAPAEPVKPGEAAHGAAICRFGGVGDNLIAASVLPGLKAKYGRVDVLTADVGSVVFENNPHADRVVMVDRTPLTRGGSKEWQEWFKFRASEYGFFANLSHSCETMTALSVGQTQFWWRQEFRRKWCNYNYLEMVHDICGVPHEFGPLFYPTAAEREKAKDTKEKQVRGDFIAWCLSGTRIDKVYPYTALAIATLIKEVAPVVMLGAPGKDREAAEAIMNHVRRQIGTVEHLHLGLSPMDTKAAQDNPSWPVRRVISMAHAANVVVGPDTGPMWGVAFEDMPKVLLLSHASEENITKHWRNCVTLHAAPQRVPCWPCHRLHDDPSTCTPSVDGNSAACMADISVESVVSTVAKLMKG